MLKCKPSSTCRFGFLCAWVFYRKHLGGWTFTAFSDCLNPTNASIGDYEFDLARAPAGWEGDAPESRTLCQLCAAALTELQEVQSGVRGKDDRKGASNLGFRPFYCITNPSAKFALFPVLLIIFLIFLLGRHQGLLKSINLFSLAPASFPSASAFL